MPPKTTAIIVAAGHSRRMGFNKLTALLAGKPVLLWAIEAFDACPAVDTGIVVAGEAVTGVLNEWLANNTFRKPWQIHPGGTERYLSVQEGLRRLAPETEIVAVHDGARPLIAPAQIARCIDHARLFKAVACARPITETMKRVDAHGVITGSIDREGVWIMETPQVFDRALLCAAYDRIVKEGFLVTDDVSAVQHHGARVFVVDNLSANPKITFPADLALAETLLQARGIPPGLRG